MANLAIMGACQWRAEFVRSPKPSAWSCILIVAPHHPHPIRSDQNHVFEAYVLRV